MRAASWRTPAIFFYSRSQRRLISDARPFAVGDLVLLRQKQDRAATPILTRPLKEGRRIESHRGVIKHDDLIGRRVRDTVKSTTTRSAGAGTDYRLYDVTLDDYVRLTRRLVTPIYPADANLIVSLLDLHPGAMEAGSDCQDPKLEILEAGTGHGALTLYLSRAIHAANSGIGNEDVGYDSPDWKARRRAILHTTDVSPNFAGHAQNVVKGFRQGIYSRNIDFHTGDVSEVVRRLQEARDERPFLSHAFLDLPSSDTHLARVADALRVDGTLVVFNPSITQITACASMVKDQQIPLDLDKVVELGVNGGSGGREWDVRFVRPRAHQRESVRDSEDEPAIQQVPSSRDDGGDTEFELGRSNNEADKQWSMVCRPRVGERINGGGFLGVWKKQRDTRDRV